MAVFQAHSLCCVAPVRPDNFELKSCSLFPGTKKVQETFWHTMDASQFWKKKKKLGKQGYYSFTLLIHWLI